MEVVCPSCATRVSVIDPPNAGSCPSCGQDLAAGADPCASDAGLASLSADLREAFGSGVYGALSPDDDRWLSFSGKRSLAPEGDKEAEPYERRLGDFELLGELGRGGMGIVYRARQISLDREVALKVLPPSTRRNRAAVARFRRESQAAARLHHTNIVPIYAQGEYGGKFYYAMELIEGESLDSAMRCDSSIVSLTPRPVTPPEGFQTPGGGSGSGVAGEDTPRLEVTSIQRTRRDYRRMARLLAEVADGLEHVHRNGIIHRDIKPHNLLLGQDHHLHITDFGLAHLMDEPHLTLSGEVMGTPAYMSPEQVRADQTEIDHRTDVYSLGVTLYELLTLRRPFEGGTREQIIHRICSSEPPPLRRVDPRIPLDLETICLRAIEKEPVRRYPSSGALAEDLRRFAEDRPILTRRTGRIEKALKWARRHQAAALAIVAGLLVVVTSTALAASMISAQRREAARLLDQAYIQLVYHDYRKPELVADDVDRAEQLGGNAQRIELIRTLSSMLAADTAEPVRRLEALCEVQPDAVELRYLLAWAYWRNDQYNESRACFERAEYLGGAQTAAEWFFRGLASQFADPERAIQSYNRARQVRARENAFYPQATMHLARARNQLMYRTRSIEAFDEAENALLDLIDHQVYDAKPYYLLSIAHRLAAEIYAGSDGTRPDRAEHHYAQALHWAIEGQELAKPGDDAPLTAEAECLESMGDFEAAIAARTAAIEVADVTLHEWEGLHYRWRLFYWTDQLDEALEDLEAVQELIQEKPAPERLFYSFVYPMLVHAEAGRMAEALALARAIAAPAEESPDDSASSVLWSATCLRLLGHAEEADRLLAERADTVDPSARLVPPQSADWMAALYAYAAGVTSFEALLEVAEAARSADRPKLLGEAYFHAAALKLASGDRAGVLCDLEEAYRSFDGEKGHTYRAKILRTKLKVDPLWPPWVHLPGTEPSEGTGAD